MKTALGKLRDYLFELFGDDSADKDTARKTLGIDLTTLAEKEALSELEAEITRRGSPISSIHYFATTTPPSGYLKADGAAVGRETYPELFAAIGTTFGAGDGSTTFNLPDLIGLFAQGSNIPGEKIAAGLPNIKGGVGVYNSNNTFGGTKWHAGNYPGSGNSTSYGGVGDAGYVEIDASGSNPIYGASNTVQPPALTLLPCIKAFDAATNPGLIDIGKLAQEMANKTDRTQLNNYLPLTGGELSGKLTAQALVEVTASDSVNEGGELHLLGAGANSHLVIDNVSGDLRIFNSPVTGHLLRYAPGTGQLHIGDNLVRYVTQTYNDGSRWYRKWSDGWLEQGGIVSAANNIWVQFVVPFANTNYTCMVARNNGTSGSWTNGALLLTYNKATTGVTIQGEHQAYYEFRADGQGA